MSLMEKVLEQPKKHFETKIFSKIAVARKVYFYQNKSLDRSLLCKKLILTKTAHSGYYIYHIHSTNNLLKKRIIENYIDILYSIMYTFIIIINLFIIILYYYILLLLLYYYYYILLLYYYIICIHYYIILSCNIIMQGPLK